MNRLNRLLTIVVFMFALVLTASAQQQQRRAQGFSPQNFGQQKFSPEKFKADIEKYITNEAGLTPQEAAKFFPIYSELYEKQRAIFERQRQQSRIKPADEKGCRDAIRKRDEIEVELKQLLQTYHNKMLNVIPASKLYDVIQAEDRFHRSELKRWSFGQNNQFMQRQQQYQRSRQRQQK